MHQNRLTIEADGHGGFTFRRHTGRRLDDHARVTKQRVRDVLAKIRRAIADDNADGAAPTPKPKPRPPRIDAQWLTPIDPDRLSGGGAHLYELIDRHRPSRT